MVAEKTDPHIGRDARGMFTHGNKLTGGKKPKYEKAEVLWTAALLRAKRLNHKSIAEWLASDEVTDSEFFKLFAKAIPRDIQVDAKVTLTFEDWLTDLEQRAAEEQAALDKLQSPSVRP